jgi:hypothetical protein
MELIKARLESVEDILLSSFGKFSVNRKDAREKETLPLERKKGSDYQLLPRALGEVERERERCRLGQRS